MHQGLAINFHLPLSVAIVMKFQRSVRQHLRDCGRVCKAMGDGLVHTLKSPVRFHLAEQKDTEISLRGGKPTRLRLIAECQNCPKKTS